jgi:imidazole glycerol-phosphate synthase subunit HisF
MLRPRLIPCLLIRDSGLTKTVQFSDGKYVGDPINVVRIFNEKQVDELMVLDIDATVQGRAPDLRLISQLAAESRMPVCFGGGITTVEQAKQIIGLGVEKVALSDAAIIDPTLITRIAKDVGSQSVVAVLDVRRSKNGKFEVFTRNGERATGHELAQLAASMQAAGVGEIVVNSIDNDGVMKGYDLEAASIARAATTVPLTITGGAGSLQDIEELISKIGIVGAGAGSLFVFKGPYKAVLVSYPTQAQKEELFVRALGKISRVTAHA